MKRMFICQTVTIVMLVVLCGPAVVMATSPPKQGGVLPDITLATPTDTTERDYLGLPGGDTFKIPQIKAEVVIIQIFSMYCPHCQREAPRVNELYRIMEETPALKGRMKLIGIGTGNSPFEVDVFKKTYKVPFPLFADRDFSIHKSLGEVRTPYFIGVRIKGGGAHEVFYSKLGGFEKPQAFFELMVELSNLK